MRAEWNIGLRAQQDTKRNERELARNSGGGFEASMQSFCLAQLADVPQQEGSQARYQEQGMQAHLSARATNLKTHSSHYRLGVSKTLFDLHALRIHRHNLIGAVCVQFGRVR